MSSSPDDPHSARALSVATTPETLSVMLADGRMLTVPLAWYPRLAAGSPAERENWHLTGGGEGIHWPSLDEDVHVTGLLAARRSQEASASFEHWRSERVSRESA